MNYNPVRITTIKPEKEIPFSVFIFFKEQYLEYVTPGMSIEKDKYKKLRKQKITKFYIPTEQEGKYQEFLDSLLDDVLNDENASVDEKSEIVEGQAVTAMEKLTDDPGNEESYNMTKKAAANIRKLIFENPDAAKKLFGDTDDLLPIFNHSMNVCVLSVKFALSLKMADDDIDLLATAALMHDVGLTQLDEDIQAHFTKAKADLSAQEKVQYWEHCKNIKTALEDKPYINGDIIKLIENHEENRSGTGPNKVAKLTQEEEILSLVNLYDKKVRISDVSPVEVLKNMMIDEIGNYDMELIKKFQDVLIKEGVIEG